MIGRKVSDFLPPEDKDRVMNKILLDHEGIVEHGVIRKDGARITVEGHGRTETYRGRKLKFAAVRDITGRITMEEQLRRARTELEQRVLERTAELQAAYKSLQKEIAERERLEEQLRHAHKMEAIGTLAGGIAHDFNNMLAIIIGNAELALEDVGEEGPRQNINQILSASMRSSELVKKILTFGRKQANQGRVVRIVPVIQDIYEFLRASIPTTVRMRLDIGVGADTAAFLEPSELQQVMINLANNAAYAMRKHGGDLAIGLSSAVLGAESLMEKTMRPGRYVKLTVRDTGTGISPDVQRRMFEPFFTTKPQGEGTGMGLSVAYGIVKSRNGMIEVESEIGKGSTFTVLLPQQECAPAAREARCSRRGCANPEYPSSWWTTSLRWWK
jgi:C4-dicarboxylate-specific signal transduction histidine kinase